MALDGSFSANLERRLAGSTAEPLCAQTFYAEFFMSMASAAFEPISALGIGNHGPHRNVEQSDRMSAGWRRSVRDDDMSGAIRSAFRAFSMSLYLLQSCVFRKTCTQCAHFDREKRCKSLAGLA
jgi:hypothetical protein